MSVNSFHLASSALQTLRWYLAEQQCLTEDNRVLLETFSEIFPPKTVRSYVPLPTVCQETRMPVTVEQLLSWLANVFNSKTSMMQAYIEFFDKIGPMATGKVVYREDITRLYGDMAHTLRDFLARQQPFVRAVRRSCDALARVVPVDPAALVPPVVRQLPRPPPAAATHSYVERFLDRLIENLDAERSLDIAHETYCALVCRPAVIYRSPVRQ